MSSKIHCMFFLHLQACSQCREYTQHCHVLINMILGLPVLFFLGSSILSIILTIYILTGDTPKSTFTLIISADYRRTVLICHPQVVPLSIPILSGKE